MLGLVIPLAFRPPSFLITCCILGLGDTKRKKTKFLFKGKTSGKRMNEREREWRGSGFAF